MRGADLIMRIGHGYDAHRLAEGRRLVLGGEEIPYELGLMGHSDADVLVHAVMDAILGAAGLPDIGRQFPDSDSRYKDSDSIELLRTVGRMIKLREYYVVNIDATIIAQNPKLMPYLLKMSANIAAALDIDFTEVNIKATTEEKMGFTGAEEGIAAHCVCLLDSF